MPSRKRCRSKNGKYKKCSKPKKRSGSKKRSKSKKRGSGSKSKKRSKSSKKGKKRSSSRCRTKGRFSPCADKIPKAPRMTPSRGVPGYQTPGYQFQGAKLKHCGLFTNQKSCSSRPRCIWYSFNNTCHPATGGSRSAALKLGGPSATRTGKDSSVCGSIGNNAYTCMRTKGCKWTGSACRDKNAMEDREAALKLGGPVGKYSPVCASMENDESKCSTTEGCKWVGGNVPPRCRPKAAGSFF
jgi:hypothetical protein